MLHLVSKNEIIQNCMTISFQDKKDGMDWKMKKRINGLLSGHYFIQLSA